MPLYSIGISTSSLIGDVPQAEFYAGGSPARILEIGMDDGFGNMGIAIGRPLFMGTGSSPVYLQALDPDDQSSLCTMVMAWTVQPQRPVNFIRRFTIGSNMGSTVKFFFPKGLLVPSGTSMVWWSTQTSSARYINITVEQ